MSKNEKVALKETADAPRKVTWFRIGRFYQIRTSRAIFARAKVTAKKGGSIDISFFGVSRTKQLQRPNTPLLKAMQPVLCEERLPINTVCEAREVL